MPSANEILAGLQEISTEGLSLSVGWHVVVWVVVVALLLGWQPTARTWGLMMAAPLFSVSAVSFAFHNPFNGAVFALLTGVLAFIAARTPPVEAKLSERWATVLGGLLIAFAWVYPHFTAERGWVEALAGAPMGLIPCPTLSLVTGLTLIGAAPPGRAWGLVVGIAALFYGLFGAIRLGVVIDLALLAGSVGVLVQVIRGLRMTPMPRPSAR